MRTHGGSVSRLCRMLSVSRGGYYAWRARGESQRSRRDRELLTHIEQVHQGPGSDLHNCILI